MHFQNKGLGRVGGGGTSLARKKTFTKLLFDSQKHQQKPQPPAPAWGECETRLPSLSEASQHQSGVSLTPCGIKGEDRESLDCHPSMTLTIHALPAE